MTSKWWLIQTLNLFIQKSSVIEVIDETDQVIPYEYLDNLSKYQSLTLLGAPFLGAKIGNWSVILSELSTA